MTAAFKNVGTLAPFGGPLLKSQIMTNSALTTIGDAVQLASGFVKISATSASLFGQVSAHVTSLGMGVLTDGTAGAALGSYQGTYTVSSTNQTVANDKVMVDISKHSLWSNATSGTIATTTGSNLLGYYFVVSDQHTIDETSATATQANAQYFNWGTDPSNSALVIVNISFSEVLG